MNNKLLLLIAIGLLSTSSLLAQPKNWGIGLRLGDPVGISIKRYVSRQKAIEFNIGAPGVTTTRTLFTVVTATTAIFTTTSGIASGRKLTGSVFNSQRFENKRLARIGLVLWDGSPTALL